MQTKNTWISPPPPTPAAPPSTEQAPTRLWQRIALGAIVALAAFLNLFQLQLNGYGNIYYAAAVKSMLQSWHNFFFVSFDPGGFVTVDKPPLGLWIQTASAKLLGFSGLSLMLPQVIAGVLSVIVLYWLVRRTFGPVAGLLAALALAVTPIVVVMNRDNNLDMQLVFTMLLAAWATLRAAETGKLGWLILGLFLIGLGFNIKTLEAYLVVPAFVLLYLLGAPLSWRAKLWRLGVALLLLLVVSLAWIMTVDLTPASERPYVGSSQTNSELELAIGYNGLSRLIGMQRGNFGGGPRNISPENFPGAPDGNANNSGAPTQNGNADIRLPNFNGGGGIGSEGGSPSPFRLFRVELGGQVSWLLPLALCGLCSLAWQRRWYLPRRGRWLVPPELDRPQQACVLWGAWLFTTGTFFSVAGFFHSYYLVTVAPAICALSAAGLLSLWQDYQQRNDWRGWALSAALLLTATEQVYLFSAYQDWGLLEAVVVILCLLAAGGLIWLKMRRPAAETALPIEGATAATALPVHRVLAWQRSAVGIGMVALLLGPIIWSGISLFEPANSTLPTAGPQLRGNFGFGNFGSFRGNRGSRNGAERPFDFPTNPGDGNNANAGTSSEANIFAERTDSKLISYLMAHKGNAKFLVATPNAMTAGPIILATGEPVMAMGGFLGSDPILTQQDLAALVSAGTVRFFLTQGARPGGGEDLTGWISAHCSAVPSSEWSSAGSNNTGEPGSGGGGAGQQLYDCGSTH